MTRALSRWLPVVAYLALITWLSSKPGGGLPRWWFMRYDKVLHVLEYGGLGFLLCRALPLRSPRARVALVAALGVGFGAVDEFHQSFVPARQGNDLGDLTADLIGATLGALSFLLLARVLRRKEATP
jgi:VanZ family protein